MLKTKTSYFLIALNLNLLPPEQLLQGTGESVNSLTQKTEIDSQVAVQIVHNLSNNCPIPNWRTLFGQQIGMTSHGPVGFATLSAPTLGSAIETFIKYEPIQSQLFLGNIIQTEHHYQLQLQDQLNEPVFTQFLFEVFAKAIELLIKQLVGPIDSLNFAIEFAEPLTDRATSICEQFDSQVNFDCKNNAIIIPNNCWQLPSPLSDSEAFTLNLAKCKKLQNQQQTTISIENQVNQMIENHFNQIQSGQRPATPPPNLKDIAAQLHLTERTLIRKLKAHNSSYKALLLNNRKTLACRLLNQPQHSIADIAQILGYKETANFCRSFKSWFNQTPSQFKSHNNGNIAQ